MKLTHRDAIAVQFGLMAMGLKKLMEKRVGYSGKDDPYGNLRSSTSVDVEPWRGVMVRCGDKIARRVQFMESAGATELDDEKFADPLFDHLNYICIEAGLEIEELSNGPELLKMLYREAKDLVSIIKELGDPGMLDPHEPVPVVGPISVQEPERDRLYYLRTRKQREEADNFALSIPEAIEQDGGAT